MKENCQTELLSEYLDNELDAVKQGKVEQHLASCADCAGLLGELRNVSRQAGALSDRMPPRDLWPGIAERIGSSAPTLVPARKTVVAGRRITLSVPQLLAASLATLALGGTASVIGFRALNSESVVPLAVEDPGFVPPASFAAIAVETPYDQAIADLTAILQRDRDRLSPRTIRALEENLAIIDSAIERAREALVQDPESDYLREHLDRTVRHKLDLLRQANNIVSRS